MEPKAPTPSWIPERNQALDTDAIDSEWPEEAAAPQAASVPPDAPGVSAAPQAGSLPNVPKAPLLPQEAREPAVAAPAANKQAEPVPVAEKPVPVAEKPVPVAEKPVPVAEEPVTASSVPLPAREPVAPKPAPASRMIIPLVSLALVTVLAFVFLRPTPPTPPIPRRTEQVSAPKPTTPAAPSSLPAPTAIASEHLNPSVASSAPETAPSVASGVPEAAPSAAASVPVQAPENTAGVGQKPVLIESVPSSARVYLIEGTKWFDRGFTPATLDVPAGASLSVMLVKDGFRRRKIRVDGSDPKLMLALLPSPSASGTAPGVKESAKPVPAPAAKE